MVPGRVRKIDQDHERFRRIIKGQIKEDLAKYISGDEFITRKGSKKFSVKVPYIDIPTFRFGSKQTGGVASGDGEEGDIIGHDPEGEGEAGDSGGDWVEEIDVELEELAEILGEQLELPNIKPKGKKNLSSDKIKFTGISKSGPESLRHVKRTMREALKRQLKQDIYDFRKPKLVPIKEDKKYRTWQTRPSPELNAVIFYIMDVSGSMSEDKKALVRRLAFWIDLWLTHQYKGTDRRFIAHHDSAKEVDEEMFYKLRESGGTLPSSAFLIMEELINKHYPPGDWNIYVFYFTDGDVWSNDYEVCFNILDRWVPEVNLFAYGQTNPTGVGWMGTTTSNFIAKLDERYGDQDCYVSTLIEGRDKILPAIKTFLGKGV